MARQNGERRELARTRAADVPETIPDKLYFRIGEVARMCAVPSYVLRFWEREFPQLRPAKGGTGQRLYRRRDVEIALRVRRLLYEEGYTIPGARQWMRERGREVGAAVGAEASAGEDVGVAGDARLREMRAELEEILRLVTGRAEPRAEGVAPKRRHTGRRDGGEVRAGSMPLFALLDGSAEQERGR